MRYWLLKTEPSDYSFWDLKKEEQTRWDEVKGAQALNNLGAMQPGDLAFIYHTGKERAIVGTARVVSQPYPDPAADEEKYLAVDVRAGEELPGPVTLAALKEEAANNPELELEQWALLRQPRLSVVPVTTLQWETVLRLALVQI